MALDVEKLSIRHYPDPVLRQHAQPVPAVTEELRAVARRMIQLMHEARGVGLAAPQVGLSWRLFVANPTGNDGDDHVYINPMLADPSPLTSGAEEGCLSIPHVNGTIMRPKAITIHATDEHGQSITESSEDLLARIWQHETDHLNGVLILDRMTPLDVRANRRNVQQLETEYATIIAKR